MAKRIEWIDIAKGIAILAVVVGHTLGPYNGQFFGSLIFAFHMPIFFMLSGYLYHPRPPIQECRRGAVNLLLPYLATAVLVLVVSAVARWLPHNPVLLAYFPSWQTGLLAAVYGAGSPVFNPWHWQVQPIGAVWFLLSMFIAIQLFNGWMALTARYAQRSRQDLARGVIVIALAISGGVLGQIAYLPWAFNAALLAQVFLYAGYLVRQTNLLQRMPAPWYLLLTFMWLLSAFQGYFALTVPVSPNLLISVMGGVAGSLCVIRFSEWLSQHATRSVVRGLKRYGQLLLVVLCFHLIDLDVIGLAGWVNSFVLPHGGALIATVATIGYRIAFVTLAMWAIPHLPVLRACFLPRQYSFKRLRRGKKQYVQLSKPRDDKVN
ncbi:acyltransferase family protein [Lactiplantibacillus pentosus]|uniref:O-acetyltransferase n=1 Tax=Lactiplantibacillus pentosus DSM 20314 TaxID=1423791 RepID=A0A837R926_LACPE|nr:acyltransferase family protein [Lactiplantibacillus pentosus]AYJ41454.1 acetyltransferase [Lactiplantibacillus pentosus]KRK22727.1 o-acetyltransferase [Lactiplantibacillus pentosus DSM 20314]MCT3299669.1 acetyltransferase [Lactiplantibacillus pentosus]MCT3311629.1 acetyltransferase [Lactiplantibacillus pentosus]MCT3328727.1 acetyltransferase [Lactiplantibacillus pentosus]